MKISRPERKFVAEDLTIDAWEKIESYYTDLLERDISDKSDFIKWLHDISELEAILEEDMAWRYIKMTINTKDEELSKDFTFFVSEIQPKLAPLEDKLNRKLVASPFTEELKSDEGYAILFRSIENALDLYREENVPLNAELAEESQKYGTLSGAQSIEYDGEVIIM